ncbi:ribosomal protein L1 (chloroplast) [Guillardia theta]|uniref:Large ribosomal subunit protein uL1c n=2 Tax=Guillardia theta TaxID=55529 RepID=RK1_GUITH|nr:ribosomal protein L1 [Guillardia theta]O78413.1 RecName: Full=Large ribosomal subunit protein uL1c; AltName: Full=50S ribosomal protein L1, chloroplastic [Guillardia theta]AAC35598.1 ribosomal protein L1 [Guillardia theta]
MSKVSKRISEVRNKIENKPYKAIEALNLLKDTATAKFVESAEAHIALKLDTKYADQQLRTTLVLPKGTGKKIRIAVIAEGEKATEAINAGADLAGSTDLVQDIMKGMLDFDRLIATPDMMPLIAKLGKVLGPRGLMPSPKSGTVTSDVKSAIEEFKKGKLEYRADKSGIVHISFGKTNFSVNDLLLNLEAVQESIDKNRPAGVKGKYWKSFYICSTMGPSIQLDISEFRDKNFQ